MTYETATIVVTREQKIQAFSFALEKLKKGIDTDSIVSHLRIWCESNMQPDYRETVLTQLSFAVTSYFKAHYKSYMTKSISMVQTRIEVLEHLIF